jgi:hypothetical protein
MSILATLRTRLSGPVTAGLSAVKSAVGRVRPGAAATPDPAPLADPPVTAVPRAVAPATPAPTAPDALDETRVHLARLSAALAASGDTAVAAAGARFHGAVRALVDALSLHPAAPPEHRRPLAAWVPGLAAATERFVSLQRVQPCLDRRDELIAVLDQVARRVLAHVQAVEGHGGTRHAA